MALDTLKRLVYEITADASGVKRGMDEAAATVESRTQLIDRQKAIIQLKGDGSQLSREIKAKQLELARLTEDRRNVEIGADTTSLDASIARTKIKLAELSRQKAEVTVQIDEQGRAYNAARRLTSQVGKLTRETENSSSALSTWARRITGARVSVGPFTTNLRTMGAVLVTLGPILTGLVGSITALAGSLTEAAAGGLAVGAAGFAGLATSAAGAFFALKPMTTAFSQVSTAQKALTTAQLHYGKSSTEAKNAQQELNKTLAAAPPHVAALETRWNSLKQSFLSRTAGIRNNAASVITDAIKTAQKLMPDFARQSTATFHVAAQGVHEWLQGLRSPEAQNILNNIMGNFRQALPAILHGLGQFATAFGRIVSVASDFLPQFTRGFNNVATGFSNSTSNANQLHHTIGGLVSQTHAWFALIGATGKLLATVLTGGAASGKHMIQDLTDTLNKWNRELSSTSGQKGMASFFKDSLQTTEQLAGVLRRALTLLFAISRATEPFAKGILVAANAAGDVVTALAKVAPMRGVLEAIGITMASIWAVNKIEGWYVAARVAFGKIGLLSTATAEEASANFATGLRRTLPYAIAAAGIGNIVSSAVGGDSQGAAAKSGGAIAGAIVGGIAGGLPGAMVGSGIGSLLGGELTNIFNKTEFKPPRMGVGDWLQQDAKRARKGSGDLQRALQNLHGASRDIVRSHNKEHDAVQRVKAIESALARERQTNGPNTQRAATLEHSLARAHDAAARATRNEQRAERVHGDVRKATIELAKHQIALDNTTVANARKDIAVEGHRREAMNKGNSTLSERLQQDRKVQDAEAAARKATQARAQDELKIAQQVGPKTLNQLKKEAAGVSHNRLEYEHLVSFLDSKWGKAYNTVHQKQEENRIDATKAAEKEGALSDKMSQVNEIARRMLTNGVNPLNDGTKRLTDSTGKLADTQGRVIHYTDKASGSTQELKGKQDSAKTSTDNFGTQLHGLIRNLTGVGRTSHGMGQMIGQVTNKILSSFNVGKLSFSLPAIGSLLGGLGLQRGGEVQRQATGGFTVPGSGDGDRFHTALPVGSFVLNRRASEAFGMQSGGMAPVALESKERVFLPHQVKAIGGDILHQMNRAVPRFAAGGQFAGMKPDIIALTKYMLQHFGGYMSAGYATSGHAAGSLHYQGLAADIVPSDWTGASRYANSIGHSLLEGIHASPPGTNVSWKNGAQVPPSFWGSTTWGEHHSHIHVATAQAVKAVAARIKAIAIKGPAGPIRDALQGQADTLRDAANTYIRKHQPRQGATGSVAVGPGMLSLPELGRLTKGHGGPPILEYVAWNESGGDPHAVSSAHAEGLWQFLPSTWSGLGVPGSPFDPNAAATGAVKLYNEQGLTPWDPSRSAGAHGGWGQDVGRGWTLQEGGAVEKPHHRPPPSQTLRLPPKPRSKPQHDFSTSPGSWYDWFGRAIDFYDTRGDTDQAAGQTGKAKDAWQQAKQDVVDEEKQVRRIIQHDKRRIRQLDHRNLPKHLRKARPGPFNFRHRKKGESQHDYHKAKRNALQAWKQKKRDWMKQKRAWQHGIRQRESGVRQELPDLYQQLRVDLPTRWHDIDTKIKGQAADAALEQTASGQERYQALTEFGGNFAPLGFGVGTNANRSGTSGLGFIGGGDAATRNPGVIPGITPRPQAAAGAVPGIGARAPARGGGGMASVGSIAHDNSKTVSVTNNYLRPPEDPHTWSASLRHELGALI